MNEEINPRNGFIPQSVMWYSNISEKNNHGRGDIIDLDDSIAHSFVNGYRESRIIIEEALNDIAIFGDDLTKTLYDLVAVYHYTYKERENESNFRTAGEIQIPTDRSTDC
jgi:hypothetical protein